MAEQVSSSIRLELFGGPQIRTADGSVLTFKPQAATILALLALAPGYSVNRVDLAFSLWPDEDYSVTRHRLRVALTALRNLLSSHDLELTAKAPTVRLVTTAVITSDIEEFDALYVESMRPQSSSGQIDALNRLLSLSARPFAPGITVDEVMVARERYNRKVDEARRRLKDLGVHTATAPAVTSLHKVPGRGPEEPRISGPPAKVFISRVPHQISWPGAIAFVALIIAGYAMVARLRPEPGPDLSAVTAEDRLQVLYQLRYVDAHSLSPDEATRRRKTQAEHCIALGEVAWELRCRSGERAWLLRLSTLEPDIQSSLQWLVDHDPPKAIQLAGSLSRYWWIFKKRREAQKWLESAMAKSPHGKTAVAARGAALHAMCLLDRADFEAENALQMREQALQEVQQAHDVYRRVGHEWGVADTIRGMGHIYHALHRESEAERCLQQAANTFSRMEDRSGEASALWGQSILNRYGEAAKEPGCTVNRCRLALKSVRLFREAGNEWNRSIAFHHLAGWVADLESAQYTTPSPECAVVLDDFLAEARLELTNLDLTDSRVEAVKLRRQVARVALLQRDQPTAVEQLGYLVGPYSNNVAKGAQFVRLTGAYLRYMDRCLNPPVSDLTARQQARTRLLTDTGSDRSLAALLAEGAKMSLEEAIAKAAK